ncbi:MAG: ECF transporter S component [Atopobiaceae bacterium]|jgi:energy-coupling factor transport system substrate-specific component|nr:ECF transporter S component [Atopobiaceae bacterium]MCH4181124.1 ECF transporter S component [Atopobiaceae bacterium]MCH4215031.1 ECF transporter S component [Atopobiaceae bacterium]MCH4229860.1 ECF transporter S component [Atopobiaceae bacterium]MCH4277013.1 ECF transporter S component [Atopobiaceae bacterium]
MVSTTSTDEKNTESRETTAVAAQASTPPTAISRTLARLEAPALVAVPVVLVACAAADVEASAALSLGVVVVALGLMAASYESSRPTIRQIMPTVVLAAVACAGRLLFAAVPDVKPLTAICIVAGAVLGRRNGFMVGALAALASNAFFGQGSWTPWQMYAWGLIGYLAGMLQDRGLLSRRGVIYAFGFCSCLLYGLILNGYSVVGWVRPLTLEGTLATFATALPWDLLHGISTVGFLALIWAPWHRRIEHVVTKYDLHGTQAR